MNNLRGSNGQAGFESPRSAPYLFFALYLQYVTTDTVPEILARLPIGVALAVNPLSSPVCTRLGGGAGLLRQVTRQPRWPAWRRSRFDPSIGRWRKLLWVVPMKVESQ
jgi:hypothetical protein